MRVEHLSARGRGQYCFRDFTLDLHAGFLRRGTNELPLRPKSFEVLAYLVERNGRLVTREELMAAIWPDVAVTEDSLTKCIADIRKALDDRSQRVIRTIVRRGYVFNVDVTTGAGADTIRQPAVEDPSPPNRRISEQAEDEILRHRPGRWAWMAALAALLVAGGAIVADFRTTSGRRGAASTPDYTQVTNFTDSVFAPALSPDGRMLAFIRGEATTVGGIGDIFIKLLPDGEPVRLTHDAGNKMSPTFTPGGNRVAYGVPALTEPKNWSTWTVSVFGGDSRLLFNNASGLMWVADASPPRVLFSEVDAGVHMSIVSAAEDGTDGRVVYSPAGSNAMAHRSFLSRDRKHMLVVEMEGGWHPCRLVSLEPGSPVGRPVGPPLGQCSSAAWSIDGKWMYLSVDTGDGYHIWRQRFPDGTPMQVTVGATEEEGIAIAPDGESFLTSIGSQQSTLWIHDKRGERQITSEGYALLPRFSADGKKIYFLLRSRASRQFVSGELWSVDLDTGQRERLLPDFLLADYDVASDGSRILFVAIGDDGTTSLWLKRRDRTAPQRLSTLEVRRAFFGGEGEVLFAATEDGQRFVYRVNENGSGLHKAMPDPVTELYDVSPNGTALAAWRGSAVQVFPAVGDAPVNANALCAAAGGRNRGTMPPCLYWSRNGNFLYIYDRPAGVTYAVPNPPGTRTPRLPPGGIASARQAAALPGVRVIRERYAFAGPDPSVYAFFRLTSLRNIYRIRMPQTD